MLRRLFIVLTILFVILASGWFAMRRPDIPFDTLERYYASDSSQFLTLKDGLKVHYRDEGNPDGEVLVLVHGFSASLHTWEPWVAELGGDYRLISIDLPGHGLTRNPAPENMTLPFFVDTVGEVVEKLDVETFVFVGNSMGGATAWQFALRREEMLDGLVLVAASGWSNPETEGDRPLIFRLIANKYARALMKDFDLKALIRSGLRDSFVDQQLVTEEMVQRYASLSRGPGHREGILALMSGGERQEASADSLAAIHVPTLVLQGAADNVVAPSGAPKFRDAIMDAELIVYEAVGHVPQEEIAARSAADLRDFLNRRVWPETADTEEVIFTTATE